MLTPKVIVFAYHNVGVRCLKTLVDFDLQVSLVVTHKDDAKENIWYDSVEKTAKELGIDVITPTQDELKSILPQVKSYNPDFIFSFYYRHMLPKEILTISKGGAFNMHGSLLPKYRGRSPTNWAILHGEKETGATLHLMTDKPDAGGIVDRLPVPILNNDTAVDVFNKTVTAAEIILWRSLPKIVSKDYTLLPNDIKSGSYFGGRKPEDGEIRFPMTAVNVHNLVRAVAPPFPGAFIAINDNTKFYIYRTVLEDVIETESTPDMPTLYHENSAYYLQSEPDQRIRVLSCGIEGEKPQEPEAFFNQHNIKLPWRFV
ncbi:MAG: hypothetical protein A2Z20_05185 [Bdellovibrionales bacterium RBG_16_40_8]|nr:MAG: hypothetical protein A2Z20_05185 [Bdellovibrionales bacterium RBG_16_40_8]